MNIYEVISPAHYVDRQVDGYEPIDLIEQFPCAIGNAMKYLIRAGFKPNTPKTVDLRKARWYLFRVVKSHSMPVNRSFCIATIVPVDEIVASFAEKNNFLSALFSDWEKEKTITKKSIATTIEMIDQEIDRIDVEGTMK